MANTNAGYIDENAIRYINLGDGIERPIDAVAVGGKTIESIGTLVTTWSGNVSDDSTYPSAKLVYDTIGDLERILGTI